MHLGQLDSDSVWNLQRALVNHGIGIRSPKPMGEYLPGTKQAVQKLQLARQGRRRHRGQVDGQAARPDLGTRVGPE